MLRPRFGSFSFTMLYILLFVLGVAVAAPPELGIFAKKLRALERRASNAANADVGQAGLQCPRAGIIYPCSCLHTADKSARVHCHDVNLATDLNRILGHLSKFQISTLMISDSSMDHLPGHFLLPMEINVLHLSRVNYSRLSFFYNEMSHTYPMAKLPHSLYAIEVEKANGIEQWDWSGLQGFKILDQIRIMDSSFPRLTKSFGSLPNTVETIIFENVRKNLQNSCQFVDMETIANGALARLHNLRMLRINRTPLGAFERNVLPRPADQLRVLDLAHNRLSSLPNNLFSDMPNLDVISLKGNQLATLASSTFAQINFASHFKLYLNGNPFNCDCKISWLSRKFLENRGIFGNELDLFCSEPLNLRGERPLLLEPNDFECSGTYDISTSGRHFNISEVAEDSAVPEPTGFASFKAAER